MLDEKGFAEKFEGVENLVDKLKNNFNKNLKIDTEKVKEINNFSNKIFENVILEYNKFIK